MLSLLRRNRNYRLLLSATAISSLGDGVSALAFPWLATLLTRDPVQIALIGFAARLPMFLFALPAGVVTDRVNRQKIMVRADVFRMVLTLGIVALILSAPRLPPGGGAPPFIAALAALAFLLGAAQVLRDNAAQTALPSVVDAADLEAANGQMWSVEHVMSAFVGPPLAGVLIARAVSLPFGFDALTFGAAAALVAAITMRPRQSQAARQRFLAELRQGIDWMRAHPVLLRLALVLGVVNALSAATDTMLVLYAREGLALAATGFGLLMTAGAAGGVIGGFVSPPLVRRFGATPCLRAALAAFGLGPALLALGHSVVLAGLALFIYTGGGMLWNIVTVSYRQRVIPDALLGRVNSVYRFLGLGMMPLGALAGGVIVAAFEPSLGRAIALRMPFATAAIGGLMLTGYGLYALRLPEP
ncbi:MAG: MFS transporter [Rhodobacteraceae bacterium]|nr:MFS transporter [Paracoccaceae bacterium]